jgi:hypothetical protein
MRYVKDKKPLMIDRAVDDNMLEGAAVRSAQSAYQERNFALHAAPSTPDGVQKSVNVRS